MRYFTQATCKAATAIGYELVIFGSLFVESCTATGRGHPAAFEQGLYTTLPENGFPGLSRRISLWLSHFVAGQGVLRCCKEIDGAAF